MAKITLSDLSNALNDNSTINTINSNNDAIETAIENTLSRDGTTPNTMSANLDMNSNRIVNLPSPVNNTEPLRLVDLTTTPTIYVQDEEPTTNTFANSLWIDSDSTDLDLYQLVSGLWTDTGVNLKGATGATGATGAAGADGEMAGPGTSVDGEIALFNGTGGATLKRASSTGILKATSGVIGAASAGTDYYAPSSTDVAVLDGGTGASDASGARTNLGLVIGTNVQAYDADILFADVSDNLTVGFTTTSYSAGSKTTGIFTPDPTLGNIQHYTNGGAHTLAPPSSVCTMILECTNSSAGALTTSGFTFVTGDTYSSAGTKKHIFYITKTNSYSHLHIVYVTGT